jgi:hypothetical protein
MQKTDEYIESRLRWKAEKYNLPSQYSSFFENLSDKRKDHYSELLKELNVGIPTLIFTQPNSNKWTIIGTRKIAWGDDEKLDSLMFEYIKEIRPHSLNSFEKVKQATNNSLTKKEWNELTLTEKNGNKRNVYAYKGSDYFAMWNILLMVWKLN